jgi:tight adherence protein B
MIFRHLETKRKKRLDEQIVDGITTLASGVRAGLTLVQSMQLLVRNSTGPLKQEFRQLMREFDLGIDLHQAMRNTSDRIGSVYYRLLFSAIQAHRDRGGDMGQSLDRIAESVREIQRLEGRLDAITAQGRAQARFMGIMPFVIIGILWLISPDDTSKLLTEPLGRVLLMIALVMIGVSFMWIRRIMQVDI